MMRYWRAFQLPLNLKLVMWLRCRQAERMNLWAEVKHAEMNGSIIHALEFSVELAILAADLMRI